MDVATTRFGTVTVAPEDILLFPNGLLGFEDCRHWVLLADASNPAVGWLQCVSSAHIAVAVVSPRRFVADYRLRVTRGDLQPLQLGAEDQTYVLSLLSNHEDVLTTNLKAPVVINLPKRLGRQVVACDDQPIQHELARQFTPLRKSA